VRVPHDWRQNLGLKILSCGLALLLWLYVHGTKVVERPLVLPLRLTNLPDSLALLAAAPHEARVLVSGPAQELFFRRIWPGAELRVDLAGARPPSLRVAPGPGDVTLGAKEHLAVLRVLEPAVLEVGLDRRIERTLPVRVVLEGEPPSGHGLAGAARAEPHQVRCTGPESRLANWQDVPTRPVSLAGRRGAFTERVALDAGRDMVACQPSEVSVAAPLARLGQRQLQGRPVILLHAPGPELAVDLQPERATVVLSGPLDAVAALDPDDVRLVLDVSTLRPGEHQRLRLVAELPDWARLDSVEPALVDVTLRRSRR
jgi:hypothetical protein